VGAKILVAVVTGRSRAILTDRTYAVIMKLLGAMLFVFAAMLLCQGLGMLGVAVCRWQH
jgi:NhaP-type Na+/H+ or K+/H+ antiporter